jgi:hypothetical protein
MSAHLETSAGCFRVRQSRQPNRVQRVVLRHQLRRDEALLQSGYKTKINMFTPFLFHSDKEVNKLLQLISKIVLCFVSISFPSLSENNINIFFVFVTSVWTERLDEWLRSFEQKNGGKKIDLVFMNRLNNLL